MRELEMDAWSVECDVLAITTNATVLPDGRNVMGGGIALEAAKRYPPLPFAYGSLINAYGPHVYLVPVGPDRSLLMFPTKADVAEKATLRRIGKSIEETKRLADIYNWSTIAVPRPGAGLGGLDWEGEVKPFLAAVSDERFLFVGFPEE